MLITQAMFLIYVVHVETRAVLIVAPTQTKAVEYGKLFLDVNRNNSDNASIWGTEKAYVRDAWYTTTVLPTFIKVTKTPTLQEFTAISDTRETGDYEALAGMMMGYTPAKSYRLWYPKGSKPSDKPYMIFFSRYEIYAWYQSGTTKSTALTAANEYWIKKGVYGYPTVTWDKWQTYQKSWDPGWMGKTVPPFTLNPPRFLKLYKLALEVETNEEVRTSVPSYSPLVDRRVDFE